MKRQLLDVLNGETTFVSGQQMSEQLHVSRTAVWKQIEELRKEGYVIEAVSRKGYRLISRPDALNEAEIRSGLTSKAFGQSVHYEKVVDSTQRIIKDLHRNKAAHGTIAVCEQQTNGRGRLNRPWQTEMGQNIMFSTLVKPDISLQLAPQMTLVASIAVAKTVEAVTGEQVSIKWPNDIYLNGKKIAGILTEVQAEANCVEMMVIGIGMNVNESKQSIEENDLSEKATSLSIETNRTYNRRDVLQQLLITFENEYERWLSVGFASMKTEWEERAHLYQKRVTVKNVNREQVGTMVGITDEGVLKLQDENGDVHLVYSGDLH
ncbi:biotin--[acetyl-CoA-carboxylase] ligase [Geomicrobium sediminis]|uniref:Bifunctional ligase/repressor BirA n=1 Tax=Geomicrobium sediminis TaxID=1347788 RepID=A0ABS2PDK0_9BACL|nr:biotin--[acetyl-CoA-carboxylase] ligase [Geomicrobium sediminis]MBM7633502.1 BirA family biotin operon repressor/biotin-[acetyl-CoA-carboxylase] ligase [Geomicrobium sediminis]